MDKKINCLAKVEAVDQASAMVGYPGNPDGIFISFSTFWSAVQEAENLPVPPGAIVTLHYDKNTKRNRVEIAWESAS